MALNADALATLIISKLNSMPEYDSADKASDGIDNFAKALAEAIVEHIKANLTVTCSCSYCGGTTIS